MQNTVNKCVNRGNACMHALYAPQWAQFDTASSSGDDDYINSSNNELTVRYAYYRTKAAKYTND